MSIYAIFHRKVLLVVFTYLKILFLCYNTILGKIPITFSLVNHTILISISSLTIPFKSFRTSFAVVERTSSLGCTPSVVAGPPRVAHVLATRAVAEVAGWTRPAARPGRSLLAFHSCETKSHKFEAKCFSENFFKSNPSFRL